MTTSANSVPEPRLDPFQRRAAESIHEPAVVVGGPGTGKTQVIVARIAHLLNQKGVILPQIACVVGSLERVVDLRHRLLNHPHVGTKADRIFVGTMTHLAHQVIRTHADWGLSIIKNHYSLWDEKQACEVMTRVCRAMGRNEIDENKINPALHWHRLNMRRWPDDRDLPARDALWQDLSKIYTAAKVRQHALDSEDIAALAVRVVVAVRGEYRRWRWDPCRHLVVDAGEDLTGQQLRLLELLVDPDGSLICTTDPNQEIHGSYAESVVKFWHVRYSNLNIVRLTTTHVGTAELSSAAASFRRSDENAGLKDDGQDWDPVRGARPQLVVVFGSRHDLARQLVADVQTHHDQGDIWSDMAVLARSPKSIDKLKTALMGEQIPYHDRPELTARPADDASRILAILNCVVNRFDLAAVARAAGTLYVNKSRALDMKTSVTLLKLADQLGLDLIAAVDHSRERFEGTAVENLDWLVRNVDELAVALEYPQSDLHGLLARVENLTRWRVSDFVLSEDQIDRELGVSWLWSVADNMPRLAEEDLRAHLRRFLEQTSAVLVPSWPASPGEGVSLSTVHGAKGQFWPMVWIADVSDQAIPGHRPSRRLEREQRIFHVAVTRATKQLRLYCLGDTGLGDRPKPSRFLNPIWDALDVVEIDARAGSQTRASHS